MTGEIHLADNGALLTFCGVPMVGSSGHVCERCESVLVAASVAPGLRRALVIARSLRGSPSEIESRLELELERSQS